MTPGKEWIRIDICRHLELVPRLALRDIISVKRADVCCASIEAATHIAEVDPRPMSNTIERHEQAMLQGPLQGQGLFTGMATGNTRKKGKSHWLRTIWNALKGVIKTGVKLTPIGDVMEAGAGLMQTIRQAAEDVNMTDNYTGGVRQG